MRLKHQFSFTSYKFIIILKITFAVLIPLPALGIPLTEGLDYQNISGPCIPREFEQGNIVCVCNATYCDDFGPMVIVPEGKYLICTSSKDGLRFEKQWASFQPPHETPEDTETQSEVRIQLSGTRKQTILGFGGAFTDAAGINANSLSDSTKSRLLRSYFSTDGIEYTLGRVPIGGTDFSTRQYTYDDGNDGDFDLRYFNLTQEDFDYKIPLIKEALLLSNGSIKLFASSWSAPAWMKTNEQLTGLGSLKGDVGGSYYQTWANYMVKFFDEYANNGIHFWGLTTQNEPLDGNIPDFRFNSMGFTAESLRVFIASNLGPSLQQRGYEDVKIIAIDDQRILYPQWPQEILKNDSDAYVYVSGFAVHWYDDFLLSPDSLTRTHELFPDKFLLATEASAMGVVLGSWERGEDYAYDIIQDLQHWIVGWMDWNIDLDMQGGPTWASNYLDSPIIVDTEKDEFYKQPTFYTLGHFSKFIRPGAFILETSCEWNGIRDAQLLHLAAQNQDNTTVIILLNKSTNAVNATIQLQDSTIIYATIPAQAIQTYMWQSGNL